MNCAVAHRSTLKVSVSLKHSSGWLVPRVSAADLAIQNELAPIYIIALEPAHNQLNMVRSYKIELLYTIENIPYRLAVLKYIVYELKIKDFHSSTFKKA